MSATLLKFFALFFMTLDHIYDYFPGSPLFFKWIGKHLFFCFYHVKVIATLVKK